MCPLPVANLLFVGKSTAVVLNGVQIWTNGDLTNVDPACFSYYSGRKAARQFSLLGEPKEQSLRERAE